ncbi:mucin-2-like [Mytilus trossulus]|uniref:mucin-2-like n=1 Tax=Mytilus trossulus TaxID=6551 RepID=UPI0030060EE7
MSIRMFKGLILCVFVWIKNSNLSDAACLDCKGISQPEDCAVVTRCGPHEQCSVEEYVTNDGNTLYDVGCKDTQRCNLNGFGRRQANTTASIKREIGTVVCSECCNSRLFPLCNIAGCGIKKPTLPVGSKICYKCPISIHPDECTQLTLCNKNQSCFITETNNLLGHHRWQHGCIDKQSCPSQSSSASSPCSYCCDMDVCNDQCNKTTVTKPTLKPSTSSMTPLTVRSTTSTISSTSTQASIMTPTLPTQTHKTTTISIFKTTAMSTAQSTTISTLQTTAIPTVQPTTISTLQTTSIPTVKSTTMSISTITAIPTAASTTIPTKTTTTISTRRSTTAKRLSSTIDTSTRLNNTTAKQATLSSPIIIDVTRNPQVVHFGNKVTISCTAIGYPPPIYNFKFKDGPLPNNARATGNTLTILNFVSTNAGNYECIATNTEGTGNYGVHIQAFL